MKQLASYINESIFNTSQNIKDESEIEKIMFNDYNSPFWKYIEPSTSSTLNHGSRLPEYAWERAEKEIDIDKKIIWIPDLTVCLNTREEDPLVNKYSLYCSSFYIGNPLASGPHPEPVIGKHFKEIICDRVQIDGMAEKVADFKFNTKKASIRWASDLEYLDVEFVFQYVEGSNGILSLNDVRDFPRLDNVVSNNKILSIYDCSFFDNDDIKRKLDNFFGPGKINGNGIIKNKSTRNIVAMVNNIRKYEAVPPEEFKPVGKLSDLINLKGFKNIEKIIMRSNNVTMTFVKPDDKEIEKHARFIRLNNMKKYKNYSIPEMIDEVKKCTTKDGWVLLLTPNQFG